MAFLMAFPAPCSLRVAQETQRKCRGQGDRWGYGERSGEKAHVNLVSDGYMIFPCIQPIN